MMSKEQIENMLTKNSKSDDFTITPIDAYKVSIQTKINTEMKVIY